MAKVHGAAHITGGGVPEKLGRVLRISGLGARLDDLFEPGQIVSHCQKEGGVSDLDAYRAWNMGQGMAVITPEPEVVIKESKQWGIEARVAGEVTVAPGITIKSKGALSPGMELRF